MTVSIVETLKDWVRGHAEAVRAQGIQVEERLLEPTSAAPWTATVGLILGDVVVSYTVWERTVFQTSLIVENVKERRNIFFRDSEPGSVEVVTADLNDVVESLVNGEYLKMTPKRGS